MRACTNAAGGGRPLQFVGVTHLLHHHLAQDGIKLFTYSFYKQRRADVQAFFAQIYSEAQVRRVSCCGSDTRLT